MPSKRSRLWFTLGGLVAILVVAALVVPYLIDLETYKPLIVEQIKKETGRAVEIGALRLHLLPSIRVAVSDFRLKHPRGFPEGDTLRVSDVALGVALMPLFSRRVQIDSVSVSGVELNLLSDENGRTSYEFKAPPKPAPRGKAAEEPLVQLSEIGAINVSDVTLRAGSFWSSNPKKIYPTATVTGLNAEVRHLDPADPKPLRKLEATVPLGGVEISTPALKEPLRCTSGELRAKDNAADGEVGVKLGSLRANATLRLGNLERGLPADFTLSTGELNLAELPALLGPGAPGAPRAAASHQLLARGKVKAERVVMAPLAAGPVEASVKVYGDEIEVNPFSLGLYGGKVSGTGQLNTAQESMPASVNAKVENVDVAKALAAAQPGSKQKLTGKFGADAALNTALGGDPLAALAGQGTFAVRDGAMPGVNIEGTLATLAKFMQFNIPKGDTQFRFFGGDFRIEKQRVHSTALKLESEALQASLAGSFGFDQTLNYRGSGTLTGKGGEPQPASKNPIGVFGGVVGKVAQQTVGRMSVPFSVGGTMAEPKFALAGIAVPSGGATPAAKQAPPPPEPKKKKGLFDVFKRP